MASTAITAKAQRTSKSRVPGQTVIIFGATSFLSALLLFQVQLIVSKYILPWFGGSAAVWTTSMLVFQMLLLAGYLYSHVVSERLSQKAQSRVHLGVLAAACLLVVTLSVIWPSAITPGGNWKPHDSVNPVRDVLLILLVSAGLPFFVLSTTGPLLQRWFSKLGVSRSTYRLYAVSNLGSLIGLLSFPFLLEPIFRMTSQGKLWALAFGLFAVGCSWCAWNTIAFADEDEPAQIFAAKVNDAPAPSTFSRLLWLLLPACASALLLATTNLLCQEITAIPLLWVLPLALYLLSFVLSFDHPRWYRREIFHPLFAVGVLTLWMTMRFRLNAAEIVTMPLLLFVACMVCHGELARLKPAVRFLTSFYLAISAGGALGGIFVAVIAPRVFRFFTEYQVSLAACVILLLCCLIRDQRSWFFKIGFGFTTTVALGVLVGAYLAGNWIPELAAFLDRYKFYPVTLLISVLVVAGAFLKRPESNDGRRAFEPGQVFIFLLALLCLAALYQSLQTDVSLVAAKRNFYGALRVFELPRGGRALYHGQTLHGAQMDPPNDHLPMAYYGPDSGIGILLRNHPNRVIANRSLRVGIVGMGAGTLAAYGTPGDYFRYYEINPDVVSLSAGEKPVFTYVRDSGGKVDTETGDARLLLENEAARGNAQNFDVLVLDAFSGDAVPVHLLTVEAFDTYWKHVNPEHGVLAIHVSSRHINLMPVIEGTADHFHAAMLIRAQEAGYPFMPNLWVFLARNPEALQVPGLDPVVPEFPKTAPRIWTDDYSDIISLLY